MFGVFDSLHGGLEGRATALRFPSAAQIPEAEFSLYVHAQAGSVPDMQFCVSVFGVVAHCGCVESVHVLVFTPFAHETVAQSGHCQFGVHAVVAVPHVPVPTWQICPEEHAT